VLNTLVQGVGQVAAGTVGGGIGAELAGGDFGQGALYGAIGGGIAFGISSGFNLIRSAIEQSQTATNAQATAVKEEIIADARHKISSELERLLSQYDGDREYSIKLPGEPRIDQLGRALEFMSNASNNWSVNFGLAVVAKLDSYLYYTLGGVTEVLQTIGENPLTGMAGSLLEGANFPLPVYRWIINPSHIGRGLQAISRGQGLFYHLSRQSYQDAAYFDRASNYYNNKATNNAVDFIRRF